MLERMPLLLLMLVVLLAGCASSKNRAPVEERAATPRSAATSSEPAATPTAPAAEAKPMLNAEHAGKPGYYTVKPGDTLIRIGLENGQNWRDVARWNGIENPNLIEVGQVLRVVAPSVDPNAVAARGVTPTKVEPRPLDAKPPAAAASAASTPAASASASTPSTTATTPAPSAKDPDDDLGWLWPASGPVASGFEEGRSKGVAITGKAGDPVLAAADGRVVYAGSGLRGYGNLVIVKHNNTYLTAYAHNQTLLVKEDQVVRRGQRIAEMGSSDSDRVQLHFEIRKQGKPVDPQRLLPPR